MPEGNAHLVVRDPVSGNSVVPLVPGQRLTLGRAPTNHVVLHDERASRFHAEIFEAADGWTLRTPDRSLSAQVEHTIVVTRGKPLVLTA